MPDTEVLDIVALGAQGDGIAETGQGARYIPFALPAERVRPTDGLPEIISSPNPDRFAPVCKHFGVCGGCVAQHMSASLYAQWKRTIVVEAFRQRGLEPDIAPLQHVPPASRRRAVLTARRTGNDIVLGYHRRASHDLFAMEECPVLEPDIVRQLPGLRALAAALPVCEARITVLHTCAGLDITVEAGARSSPAHLSQLAQIAAEHRFARIAIDGETVVQYASPALDLDGVALIPPPGIFLQAVQRAEAAMVTRVRDATAKSKRIADLFCGLGAFTFALAHRARILAMDSDARAIAALGDAVRHAQGLKPIEARVRDLFRDPLSPRELEGFDAVVFDPPRAGAKAQAEALAKSRVPTVIAVSCNPATLARDARALVDGGYHIDSVVPIDQFLYSAHVEAVAVLRR